MLIQRIIASVAADLRRGAIVALLLLIVAGMTSLHGQMAGTNVNMVSGTQWPGGDPFLQRQNEPSMAVSSRNPLHMLAGANDYRTVDLPGVSGASEPTGDAWLGLFKSFDGGNTWTSTLVPGYPQDTSAAGVNSPLKGLGAGADPSVRAGTNGMFYYSGLAFNRQDGGASKVFVAAFTDDNNLDGGDSIRYLWTSVVKANSSNTFEDKPSLAVDIPRATSSSCVIPSLPLQGTQIFRGGSVYVAWTQFSGDPDTGPAAIMFSRSLNCGVSWSTPVQLSNPATTYNQGASLAIDPSNGNLYIAWRVFATTSPMQSDSIVYVASFDGGSTFSQPKIITNINPFDQGDTFVSFRTNDFPSLAVDGASHIYAAWSQRGVMPSGDARIMVIAGISTANPQTTPLQWSSPVIVDNWPGHGHQIMPAMEFSAGKLTVAWYDVRNDDLLAHYSPLPQGGGQYSISLSNDGGAPDFPAFGTYIQDPTPPYTSDARRQTMDVFAAQATSGYPPTFLPSIEVSQYPFGSLPNSQDIQQLLVNPPNLPMFQSGTLPFMGDYIDVAGPTFIAKGDGTWRYNNLPSDSDFTHVVWTDNRNVIPPADGNWGNYTPPNNGISSTSLFDPTQSVAACATTTNTGDRNQDIYTAQLSPGLTVSAAGNSKPLGIGSNGQLIQREFPITVTNSTGQIRYYQMSISSQPPGGVASFLQFAAPPQPYPLLQAVVQVFPLSSSSRSIFVTSTSVHATVTLVVVEVSGPNGGSVSNPETGSVTINGDPSNPNSSNSGISNTELHNIAISNPNIANPNIANPNIANPNIANPNIANPNIANPNIANPNIANPNIANPNIANPNIANPNIANTDLSDGTITDATRAITNMGNTATAYSVNLFGQSPPPNIKLQLIIYQNYTTPLAQGCALTVQSHFVPVANITNVTFSTLQQLLQPSAANPTVPGLALAPGQTAIIALRAIDPSTNNPAQALQNYNPGTQATPVVVPQSANTGTTTPPVPLTILAPTLSQATLTGVYPPQTLQATGGSGSTTWSIVGGALPTGITLSTAGVLSGTPTGTPGTFSFTVQAKDSAADIAQQPLQLVVNPAPSITTTVLATAEVGRAYPQTITATGGTTPLAFTTQSVDGLTFTSAGTFTGTPSAAGPFQVTAKVTDARNVSATQSLTLNVDPPLALNAASLPGGTQNAVYPQQQLVASNGVPPYSNWSWTAAPASSLPPGLSLSTTGVINGTPTAPGTFSFVVSVSDALGATASQTYSITVAPILQSISVTPATPTVPKRLMQQFTATGNYSDNTHAGLTGSVTWSAASTPSGVASIVPSGNSAGLATAMMQGTSMITATLGSVAGSTVLTVGPPVLTSIAVAPGSRSFQGDAVSVNYEWPNNNSQINVLYGGGSAVIPAGGATFNAGASVTVTGTNIIVTFPNGWTFNTVNPKAFDGLVITDPLANITGVSVTSPNIQGYNVSPLVSSDSHDVYINFQYQPFTTLPAGASVSVNVTFGPPASIPAGATQPFLATGIYSDGSVGSPGSVVWSASSPLPSVATIDPVSGVATGVTTGSSTITATSGAVFGSTTLNVTAAALVSIAVTPANPVIAGPGTQPLKAVGTYSDSTTADLTTMVAWASSNTSVATINTSPSNSPGLATGSSPGTTTISAILGGVIGSTTLTDTTVDLSIAHLISPAMNIEGTVQLTSTFGQASAAWSPTAVSVASGFRTTFQFQIIPPTAGDPSSAADGIAFVIQNSPSGASAIGAGGGGIGYQGIPNSLAIEFDTYNNGVNDLDNNNHIAIISDGTSPNSGNDTGAQLHATNATPTTNAVGSPPLTIADGHTHTAVITYTAGTLSLYVDPPDPNNVAALTPVVSAPVNLGSFLGLPNGTAYVGFTAGTGASEETANVSNWSFFSGIAF